MAVGFDFNQKYKDQTQTQRIKPTIQKIYNYEPKEQINKPK